MSVDVYPSLASISVSLDDNHEGNLALARQRAEDARRLAAARGDYQSAEQWHRQEYLLDLQLDDRNQHDASVWRA